MTTATKPRERPILFSLPMIRAILDGRKSVTRRVAKPPVKAVFLPDDHWKNDIDEPGTAYLDDESGRLRITCPYGVPGDILYVKETWRTSTIETPKSLDRAIEYRADSAKERRPGHQILSLKNRVGGDWRSPIFMPRWASRITLEITEVRVERLQAITEEDAVAEGFEIQMGEGTGPGPGFKWNGPGYWDGFSTDPTWGKTYHAPKQSGLCCCYVGEKEKLTPAVCAFCNLWDHLNGKRPGCSWDADPYIWVISFKRIKP